uniref:Uncharacterized protein n=1 Tax=Rhipicephalus zambeziensis TaxID=60191 RepID=A0A224YHT0_9ACAR
MGATNNAYHSPNEDKLYCTEQTISPYKPVPTTKNKLLSAIKSLLALLPGSKHQVNSWIPCMEKVLLVLISSCFFELQNFKNFLTSHMYKKPFTVHALKPRRRCV